MTEIWLPIAGYEGSYEVSSQGRVKSLSRLVRLGSHGSRLISGVILKQSLNTVSYPYVFLSINDKRKMHLVHRIVATAFLPNLDGKATVNHKNGDRLNNCVENLEWATRSENVKHAYAVLKRVTTKGMLVGSKNGRAKLSEEDIGNIKSLREEGMTQENIGKRYGVSQTCISSILRGKSWK